jgi:hypothetical protein
MESCGLMVMLSCFVTLCCGVPESVACTLKIDVPAVVGVPVICPAVLNVNPAGRLPRVTDHDIGAVPPLDCRVVV